ncbi:MAG: methyltransferase domain-containing protein [Gammaproteobacteria bacterium]|nr:methyltransferase domain-containing protein [Gammaproteobacteria bacterium]
MERIPEPELMDDEAQARAYAEADFSEPNARFVELFAKLAPDFAGDVLDLGCGPGDIALRLARRFPGARFDAVDASEAMLSLARRVLEDESDLAARVGFLNARIPGARMPRPRYGAVISNSLLHHLPDPGFLWKTVGEYAAPGAFILVMDLIRPASTEQTSELVARYAIDEPEILRRDFYNSLLAAFEPAEVEVQLAEAGLEFLNVNPVSDRHLLVSGRMPN